MFALHHSAILLILLLFLKNTLLGNAWHINFYLGKRLCFETSTQTNTHRILLLHFTQEKYTGRWLNREGKQISPHLYCDKHHSIDECSSRWFMLFQYYNKKLAVEQVKVYAPPNNNFAEPAQSPWASLIPLRLLWLLEIKLQIKISALISKKRTLKSEKEMTMGLSHTPLEINGKQDQAVCTELK